VPFEQGDGKLRVEQAAVARLERECDEFNAGLPELKSFVLPGGTEGAARLHLARTVCRRAEIEAVRAGEAAPLNPLAAAYLNRLADLLFILARAANAAAGGTGARGAPGGEPLWKPGGSR